IKQKLVDNVSGHPNEHSGSQRPSVMNDHSIMTRSNRLRHHQQQQQQQHHHRQQPRRRCRCR
ncbi:hypothetical protein RDWZM_004470, partial [Blomia tropicalis]